MKATTSRLHDRDVLAKDPARGVESPAENPREGVPLDDEQIAQLYAHVAGHRLEALYHLAIERGPRVGELLGLRWSDYDPTARSLTIAQQWRKQAGSPGRFKKPKGEKQRVIPIDAELAAWLAQHRERQRTERALYAGPWNTYGLIFPSTKGTPIEPGNVRRHFQQACAALAIPGKPVFHHLRHTAITRMHRRGIAQHIVLAICGHTTMKINQRYTHVTLEDAHAAFADAPQLRKKAG